jgi:hypothetical protein
MSSHPGPDYAQAGRPLDPRKHRQEHRPQANVASSPPLPPPPLTAALARLTSRLTPQPYSIRPAWKSSTSGASHRYHPSRYRSVNIFDACKPPIKRNTQCPASWAAARTRQCGDGRRYRPKMASTIAWTALNVLSSMPVPPTAYAPPERPC